jgi:hypothetical protein
MAAEELVAGRRIWVTDPAVAGGRSFGRIASIDRPGYLSDGSGFVVSLDDGNRVVTCAVAGRGVTWDFAEPTRLVPPGSLEEAERDRRDGDDHRARGDRAPRMLVSVAIELLRCIVGATHRGPLEVDYAAGGVGEAPADTAPQLGRTLGPFVQQLLRVRGRALQVVKHLFDPARLHGALLSGGLAPSRRGPR